MHVSIRKTYKACPHDHAQIKSWHRETYIRGSTPGFMPVKNHVTQIMRDGMKCALIDGVPISFLKKTTVSISQRPWFLLGEKLQMIFNSSRISKCVVLVFFYDHVKVLQNVLQNPKAVPFLEFTSPRTYDPAFRFFGKQMFKTVGKKKRSKNVFSCKNMLKHG